MLIIVYYGWACKNKNNTMNNLNYKVWFYFWLKQQWKKKIRL